MKNEEVLDLSAQKFAQLDKATPVPATQWGNEGQIYEIHEVVEQPSPSGGQMSSKRGSACPEYQSNSLYDENILTKRNLDQLSAVDTANGTDRLMSPGLPKPMPALDDPMKLRKQQQEDSHRETINKLDETAANPLHPRSQFNTVQFAGPNPYRHKTTSPGAQREYSSRNSTQNMNANKFKLQQRFRQQPAKMEENDVKQVNAYSNEAAFRDDSVELPTSPGNRASLEAHSLEIKVGDQTSLDMGDMGAIISMPHNNSVHHKTPGGREAGGRFVQEHMQTLLGEEEEQQ